MLINSAIEKLDGAFHLTNTDMKNEIFKVRDHCREKLSRYTLRAFDAIALPPHPVILDVGCGTGSTTLMLAGKTDAYFHALEPDKEALDWFREKMHRKGLEDRFNLHEGSVYDLEKSNQKFDLVLAEGLLNIIGFEKGLPLLAAQMKETGYLIIHDEWKDDLLKKKMFREQKLNLIQSIKLDQQVWWDEYYSCLEKMIAERTLHDFMQSDVKEISEYRLKPELFCSVIYVLQSINH